MSAAEGGETGAEAVPPSRMPAASVGTEPTDETAIQIDADNKGDATTPQEAAEDYEPPEIAPINKPPIHPGDLPVWLAAHLGRTKMARAGSPFIVEFTGTLFLTLVVAMTGGDATAPISVGFILLAMVYMGGHISGGHYNPAVSLAVYLRGKISFFRMFFYFVAQVVGGLCAARIAEISLPLGQDGIPLPAPRDAVSTGNAFLIEFLFSYALCVTVLNTATTVSVGENSFYGLAIGAVVLAGSYAAGNISGAALNPAVASGLMAVHGTNANLWLYWVAPLLGGFSAGILFHIINAEENDLRFGDAETVERPRFGVGGHTTAYKKEVRSTMVWLQQAAGSTDAADMTHKEKKELIKKSFSQLDKNNTGQIPKSEMAKTLADAGLSKEEITTMIDAADKDGDGVITFDEYESLMHQAMDTAARKKHE